MKDITIDFAEDGSAIVASEHVVLIASDLAGTASAAAFAYAQEGNHIVIASDDDEAGMGLADVLRARHVDAMFVHADAHNETEMLRLIDVIRERYGHLDVEYRS